MYDEAKVAAEIEDFLEQAGVKGMKWGRRKGGTASSAASQKGFFNKPSVTKAVLVGSYGKKSSYTDPTALQNRRVAGKLRVASILTGLAAVGVSAAAKGSPDGAIVASLLQKSAAGIQVASLIKGAQGASQEQTARTNA
jgi:hypothetical protein